MSRASHAALKAVALIVVRHLLIRSGHHIIKNKIATYREGATIERDKGEGAHTCINSTKAARAVLLQAGTGTPQGVQGTSLARTSSHWEQHGAEAIDKVFQTRPDIYLKVVASILPKEQPSANSILEPVDGPSARHDRRNAPRIQKSEGTNQLDDGNISDSALPHPFTRLAAPEKQ